MRLSASRVIPTIPCTDLRRSRQFYEGKLGLKLIRETEGELALAAGDTVLYLYVRPPAPSDHTLASFIVDDVAATVAALRKAGVVFEDYDQPGLKTTGGVAEWTDGRSAWFKDPDGNVLAVSEVPEEIRPVQPSGFLTVAEQANRHAIRRMWRRAVDPANIDETAARYAKNARYHGFGGDELRGREAIREMIAGYHAAFSDMKVKVHDIIASDDRTVVRVTVTGTHTGEFAGMPATGKTIAFDGITISRWKDGEIVEEWEGFDMTPVLEQLVAG